MAGLTQADWQAVRDAFEAGKEPVAAIAQRYGLSRTSLELCAIAQGWCPPALQLESDGPDSKDVARRLYDVIDRKLTHLEARMENDQALSVAEHETETRALGQLIRGYEKVTGLVGQAQRGDAARRGPTATEVTDDDDDPERLRDELARRIRRLFEERPGDEG